MRKILIGAVLTLCSYGICLAQRQADIVVKFDNDIQNILVDEYSGNVLIKDSKAISSYNPDKNALNWTITEDELVKKTNKDKLQKADNALKTVERGDFLSFLDKKANLIELIPGSPYLTLTLNNSDIIIDIITGELLYNSRELGYRLLSSEYMPDEHALLLNVIDDKNYSCVYYDLKNKQEKWISALSPTESFFSSLKGLLSVFGTSDQTRDMVKTTDKDIFVTISGALFRINKENGDIAWKSEDKITEFLVNNANTHLIGIRKSGNILRSRVSLNLMNISDGSKVWKDDVTTKYVSYIEDSGDKVLVAHESGFNFYNYSDGKKIWKKDAKGNKIKQVIPIDGDYLYIADKEMNLIDKDGQNKWKKFVEICDKDEDLVYHLNKIDNNRVFYLSDSYGNMVDYTTGKKVWKKDVKFNRDRPLLFKFDKAKNIYIAYNDKKIYRFDPNGKDEKKNESFARLKDVKSDDTMADIELFDWGISLVGEEDVIAVDFDGNVKYHNTYKDPGAKKRNWAMAGRIAASVGGEFAMQLGTANLMSSAFSGGNTTGAAASIYGGAFASELANSGYAERMTQRVNAMQANADYAFVLNKGKDGTEIVKIRKEDGEEVDKVSVEGTAPIFKVDGYNYNLYFVHKKELRVFSKK